MGRKKIVATHEATPFHLRQAQALALYRKRGQGAWYLPVWIDGTRVTRSTGTADVVEAIRKVPSIRAEVEARAGELSRRAGLWNLATASEAHRTEKEKVLSPNTMKGYRTCSRHIIKSFGATFYLEDFTKDLILDYINKARETRKPYTVQIEINYLGGLINWAHEQKKCTITASDVLPPGCWGNYKPRKRFLSPEEIGSFLSVCPPDWQACILGWTYLGASLNELFSIAVSDVDFRTGLVTIHGTKTKTRDRTIPIPPPLLSTLQKLCKRKGSAHHRLDLSSRQVFPYPQGERGGTSMIHIQERFHTLRVKAGIKHCTIQDLRRTCGSLLASENVSLHIIAQILGHSSVRVTEKTYSHLSNQALVNALNKLPHPLLPNPVEVNND